MATSLVAVAIPAYATDAASPPDPTGVTGALQKGLTPTSSGNTAGTPADAAGTSTDTAGTPTDTAGTPTDTAGTPANTAGSGDSNTAATTGGSKATTGAAAVAPPASCTATLGGDPTKLQACVTDGAKALAAALNAPAPPPQLAAVQTFLTCAAATKTTLGGEACGEALFKALGIPDSDCLNPAVNPILNAIDALITNQDPSVLQGELTGLSTSLPNELTQVQACLMPTTPSTPPSTPPVTPIKGTTAKSGAASSDPIAAVAVAAEPTFTG